MGFILKLLVILILARLLVGAVRYLLRGSQSSKRRSSQGPVSDKRRRARERLDGDIVDAEFEDISDKKQHSEQD